MADIDSPGVSKQLTHLLRNVDIRDEHYVNEACELGLDVTKWPFTSKPGETQGQRWTRQTIAAKRIIEAQAARMMRAKRAGE